MAESLSPLAGALMTVSVIGRALGRKIVRPRRTEIPLRDLVRITRVRYGVDPTVLALSTGDEPVLKIVFSSRQMQEWLQTLDQALRRHGKALRREGEGVWQVAPAQT